MGLGFLVESIDEDNVKYFEDKVRRRMQEVDERCKREQQQFQQSYQQPSQNLTKRDNTSVDVLSRQVNQLSNTMDKMMDCMVQLQNRPTTIVNFNINIYSSEDPGSIADSVVDKIQDAIIFKK